VIADISDPAIESANKRSAVKAKRPAYHEPVLLEETVTVLAPEIGKVIVDGTLGGGGHAEALLARGARVIGIDQDPAALAFAGHRLESFSERFQAVRGTFANAAALLDEIGVEAIDGALLDLGVSSHQLDTPERGFSFQADGPLDMRLDPNGPITAAHLVNTMSGEQLERIFREYGEEPAARKVAVKLARERMVKPFSTTLELAEAVESVIPRRSGTHPATRVFQALRIAVNRELEALEEGLEQFSSRLAQGGVFAVITFHSLEDRIVKTFFKHRCAEWVDRPEWPAPRRNPDHIFQALTRKPAVAGPAEQRSNPRSRSAKLRAVKKLTS
jgi:16S rRNA (cytosine1402-N4)-methyltransferase